MSISDTNISYLLPFLRLKIGDTEVGSYRYTNEWLNTALVSAVMSLEKRWARKYLVNSDYDVYRNTADCNFIDSEPPLIMHMDVEPILLQAAINILGGSLESYAWHLGSWRDAEIAYSNIQSGKTRDKNLDRLIEDLNNLLSPPGKRLKPSKKGELPGFKNNKFESKFDY